MQHVVEDGSAMDEAREDKCGRRGFFHVLPSTMDSKRLVLLFLRYRKWRVPSISTRSQSTVGDRIFSGTYCLYCRSKCSGLFSSNQTRIDYSWQRPNPAVLVFSCHSTDVRINTWKPPSVQSSSFILTWNRTCIRLSVSTVYQRFVHLLSFFRDGT